MNEIVSEANQKRVTQLLMEARHVLSLDRLKALLPEPFHFYLDHHATGCQPHITLEAKGHAKIVVWKGSMWFSSVYEFNDKGKWFGMNPETPFAEQTVAQFFETVEKLYAEAVADRSVDQAEQSAKGTEQYNRELDYYKNLIRRQNERSVGP